MIARLPKASQVALAVLVFTAPGAMPAQEHRYDSVQPDSVDLVPLAAALAESADSVSTIWPGFWRPGQDFLMISPRGGILLVADWNPPSDYTALPADDVPASLRGRVFARAGHLPGLKPGSFPGTYDWGDRSPYALPPMGSTFRRRLSFYVHEAFHFFQREGSAAWSPTPEDSILGLSPVQSLTDPGVVDDPAFRAGLVLEDSLLSRIAGERDSSRLIELLDMYERARAIRVAGRPDVIAIERRYERREGTATYVGCRAAAVAARAPETLVPCLKRSLGQPNPEDPILQFLRWRLYSTGGVMCLALERLRVDGWKGAVARGEHLDQIVQRELAHLK